jgi:hypothetical protein
MDKKLIKECIKEMFEEGDIEIKIDIKHDYYKDSIRVKVLIDNEEVCSDEVEFKSNEVDED